MKTPDDVMTLTEHLGELRVRIIRSALAITLGAILIIAFYDQVLDFLTQPYIDLCKQQGPRQLLRLRRQRSATPRAVHLRPARRPLDPPARRHATAG